LERLQAFYTWAIENDYVSTTPFKRGTASTLKFPKEYERDRRLQPGPGNDKSEEERLLAAASPHLRALIVAALETGCRIGELLSLQWHQVRSDLNEIHLPVGKTKMRMVQTTFRLEVSSVIGITRAGFLVAVRGFEPRSRG
jgi:integrase